MAGRERAGAQLAGVENTVAVNVCVELDSADGSVLENLEFGVAGTEPDHAIGIRQEAGEIQPSDPARDIEDDHRAGSFVEGEGCGTAHVDASGQRARDLERPAIGKSTHEQQGAVREGVRSARGELRWSMQINVHATDRRFRDSGSRQSNNEVSYDVHRIRLGEVIASFAEREANLAEGDPSTPHDHLASRGRDHHRRVAAPRRETGAERRIARVRANTGGKEEYEPEQAADVH